MTRTTTRMIVAVAFALISALAIAQATQPPAQSQPQPATTESQPSSQAQPAQPAPTQSAPQAPAPAQPAQTAPGQAQPAPPSQQPAQGQPAPAGQGTSLSSPSLQPAPLPAGCTPKADKERVRMRESCGVVTDANGKPVQNLTLELVEAGQENRYLFVFSRDITDANGRFDFGPVPSGHYLLRTPVNAPVTVYNFVALGTQIADGQCKHPSEIKSAPAGSCTSEVHSSDKGFSLSNLMHRKSEPKAAKGDQKKP